MIFLNYKGAQESIPPAYVAWRAGTTRFLAPRDRSKIPALTTFRNGVIFYSVQLTVNGSVNEQYSVHRNSKTKNP
jgi:hypothetical protein